MVSVGTKLRVQMVTIYFFPLRVVATGRPSEMRESTVSTGVLCLSIHTVRTAWASIVPATARVGPASTTGEVSVLFQNRSVSVFDLDEFRYPVGAGYDDEIVISGMTLSGR